MNDSVFLDVVREVALHSRLPVEHTFHQHGNTTCLHHSVAVAYYSWRMAERLRLNRHTRELIRAALLHDYFLYDWHVKPFHEENGLHGFSHPLTAWQNASHDYQLTKRERNIIRSHMWPLTLLHIPTCREGWVVTAVDKYCSTIEVFSRHTYEVETIQKAVKIILAQ